MTDAEVDIQAAPFDGETGLLTGRMAELKNEGRSTMFSENSVIKLEMKCVEAIIKLMGYSL